MSLAEVIPLADRRPRATLAPGDRVTDHTGRTGIVADTSELHIGPPGTPPAQRLVRVVWGLAEFTDAARLRLAGTDGD